MITIGSNFELNLTLETLPFEFIWINGGDFTMGQVSNGSGGISDFWQKDHAPIKVRISQGFWMAKYPVSRAHWFALGSGIQLEGENPEEFINRRYGASLFDWQNDNLPMYWVNWREAMKYCAILNQTYKDELPAGYHFSLPTEAHWEFVAREGKDQDPPIYGIIPGNIYYAEDIKPLDLYNPNQWGVCGMKACVRQFCFDLAMNYHENDEYFIQNYPMQDGYFIDFLPNDFDEEDSPHDISDEMVRRVCKGGGTVVFREEFKTGMKLNPLGNGEETPPLGFRVCLRPITDYDLNDPLLVREGINILG